MEGAWVMENRPRLERQGVREIEVSGRVVKEQVMKMWEVARRAREGFVGLACERLQASMGVRNDLAFGE